MKCVLMSWAGAGRGDPTAHAGGMRASVCCSLNQVNIEQQQ